MIQTTCIRNGDWVVRWNADQNRHEYLRHADVVFRGKSIEFVGRNFTGESDEAYSASEAAVLLEMIEGGPKELTFYDSGHRLPERYVAKAHQWFERHLK